jgi:hypothetical protein
VLALLLASPTQALRPNTSRHSDRCHGKSFTAKAFRGFSADVWLLHRWSRGQPPEKVIQHQRVAVRCAAGSENRKAIRATWRRDQRVYFEHREAKRAERRYLVAITPPGPEVLAIIRSCESGGDYSINTGNGFYGAFQFTLSTWASVGGSGLPSEAPAREQDERAAQLYREQGSSPWPVCGV